MLYLRRFPCLLFVLLFSLSLSMALSMCLSSTVHARPTAAAVTCLEPSWERLNIDVKKQDVRIFDPGTGTVTYTITVNTILEELVGDSGFCGRLQAVTQVTLSKCEFSPQCRDDGTATAFVVANGTRFTSSASISLIALSSGSSPTATVVSTVAARCGAAGGTYVGAPGNSGGENISSGSAQRCG